LERIDSLEALQPDITDLLCETSHHLTLSLGFIVEGVWLLLGRLRAFEKFFGHKWGYFSIRCYHERWWYKGKKQWLTSVSCYKDWGETVWHKKYTVQHDVESWSEIHYTRNKWCCICPSRFHLMLPRCGIHAHKHLSSYVMHFSGTYYIDGNNVGQASFQDSYVWFCPTGPVRCHICAA